MVLLGSGTLVSVGSIRAVLTAHHVVSILPSEGRLGLILGPHYSSTLLIYKVSHI